MICVQVMADNRDFSKQEFWDDVLYSCDSYEHLHTVEDWPPYTDAFRVTIGGQDKIYFVELPKF